MTETLSETKDEARRRAFAARKAAHSDSGDAAERACTRFLASRLAEGAHVVAGYRPIRTEIDPTPLLTTLHRSGHRIVVPVILGPATPLEFHEWWPGVAMRPGAFGAEIPVDTHVLVPDLLIVPLLAFDRAGWRLGYGGGFYDRTLEGLRAARPTRAVGFAYAAQEIAEVPREATDQPLDAIVTENETIGVEAPATGAVRP